MRIQALLALFFISSLFVACHKHDDHDEAGEVNFNIWEPAPNMMFNLNQIIKVEGEFESSNDADLHGYKVRVLNKATQVELYTTEKFEEHFKRKALTHTFTHTKPIGNAIAEVQVIVYTMHGGSDSSVLKRDIVLE